MSATTDRDQRVRRVDQYRPAPRSGWRDRDLSVTENARDHSFVQTRVYREPDRRAAGIFCYFSLPRPAVLTGLWLGIPAIARRFKCRPAARVMCTQRVQRQMTQLLEQVGPRPCWHRLRAFLPFAARSAGVIAANAVQRSTITPASAPVADPATRCNAALVAACRSAARRTQRLDIRTRAHHNGAPRTCHPAPGLRGLAASLADTSSPISPRAHAMDFAPLPHLPLTPAPPF